MPRFVLMEVYKPPLNPKKVYKESEDNINLLYGYGNMHNILLYDCVDMYINKKIKTIKPIADSIVEIKIEREEYNTRALYYYLKKKITSSSNCKKSGLVFPKYDEIKDTIYRKIYSKPNNELICTTNDFYVRNSPYYKENCEETISRLYISGKDDIEIKTSIEDIVKSLKGYYGKMPLINKVVKKYYAMCMDTIYIEDNCLNIPPFEIGKYFHEKDIIIDKLYKIKALEAIGLTEEIPNRFIEGKSIVSVIIRDEEEHGEEYIYPPDSANYGISGMFGDDEFGNDNE